MLTLICGIPNAGKTTYSSKYDNVIHLDDMHIRGGKYNNCNILAGKTEGDVVVEGVYVTAKQRRELISSCIRKSPKICIWIDTPLDVCIEREKKYRKRPSCVVRGHHYKFEQPTYDEGWDEIIVIQGDKKWLTKNKHGRAVM